MVADVVLFHREAAHLVVCESKSGANVEVDQARRYGRLLPQNVVRAVSLSLPHAMELSLEILYVGLEEHAERLTLSLDAAKANCPLLTVSDKSIKLLRPEHASANLLAGIPADGVGLLAPPTSYIPYDHESDDTEFVVPVRGRLVQAASRGEVSVTARGLAEACCPRFGHYGRQARGQIVAKVAKAARQIATEHPDTFRCAMSPGRDETLVNILRTPEDFDARGRTQAYQALSRRSRSRQRLQTDPNQLDLLQELGDGDDSEDNEAEERP
ncbi:hypothetical protein ACIRQH_09220 [Streptomyces sp. NPDC102279]|uniref:hypothetical protein n=1 Tax=Streptomyces sp. NPDC102279 TaxID=3366153 RepID=UPI00382F436E